MGLRHALKSMIIELRNLAIFHALAFVFRQERSSTKDKMDKLRDIFHGDDKKKGTAQQLLDGDGPFAHLYECVKDQMVTSASSREFYVEEQCQCTLLLASTLCYPT